MQSPAKTNAQLAAENAELRASLAEAEETLRAIRSGEVDAIVVTGAQGEQIYSLEGADHSYRVLVEEMSEGALIVAADGTVLSANPRFAEMVGLASGQVVAADVSRWIVPELRTALQALLEESGPGRFRGESVLVTEAGTVMPIGVSASRLGWSDMPGCLGLVVSDITQIKRAEAQVRKTNASLESLVEHRTAELKAVNEELEAFAYSVAHDLRTPLRAIDGLSLLLLEDYTDKLDEEGLDSLRRVRDAAQRMGQLIDDLLMLSRVTRSSLVIEAVDLSAIAHAAAAALRQAAPDRPVDLSIAAGMVARGDAGLIRIVIENLLSNAWKFTGKQAAPRIEFDAQHGSGEQVYRLRDNGVGFDMAYADKLFLPFQRLHAGSEFPGTGVGLATVKRIITRLGGQVRAEGAEGRGATFYFSLPDSDMTGEPT